MLQTAQKNLRKTCLTVDLQFIVTVDPRLESLVDDAVALGPDFEGPFSYPVGGLQDFYEDLILGKPFPLVFKCRSVSTETLVAISLFLYRDLALVPAMASVVASVGFVTRHGLAGYAHIDRDLAGLLWFLEEYLEGFDKDSLAAAVSWVRAYALERRLPAISTWPSVEILDTGSNGFVVASMSPGEDTLKGLVDAYSQGFLRGVIMSGSHALVAKKSPYLELDLAKAAEILRDIEAQVGSEAVWELYSELRLECKGTAIPLEGVVKVLVRV